jgi:SAM-dependent methyltransferase
MREISPRPNREFNHLPDGISECFKKFVQHPYNNHIQTVGWEKEILLKTEDYHRETILEQGTTDFCVPFNELGTDEKVLLYCYQYMQMHVMSSYYVFKEHWDLFKDYVYTADTRERIKTFPLFIDFGCGPLTSGLAFAHIQQEPKINFHYIGIDKAKSMLTKAEEFSKEFSSDENFLGCKFDFLESYGNDTLLSLMSKYRLLNHPSQLVILNFCYFFASKSLNVNELVITIKNILKKYNRTQVYIVFQNPNIKDPKINGKWYEFKNYLPEFETLIDGPPSFPIDYYNTIKQNNLSIKLYYALLRRTSP